MTFADAYCLPTTSLGRVASVMPSGVDKKSLDGEKLVRLCNYTDIYYNERITPDLDFMLATATDSEIERFTLRPGDVLITKDSETADDIAIPALVAEELDGVVLGYHNALLRPDASRIDARFLFWTLMARSSAGYFETKARGVTRVGLRSEDIAGLPVPMPPLEVQRRVADMLDVETQRIDSLIAKNDRARQLLHVRLAETVARAVTEGVFERDTRPVNLGWASHISRDWDVAPYQYLARIGTGHTPSRSEPAYWEDCNIPWITTSEVKEMRPARIERIETTEYQISKLGLANSAAALHPSGTVVLSRTASVGFSAIMGVDMATSQDFFTWTCGDRLVPEYLLYVLRAMKSRGHFDRMMYGSTHKTIYFPDLMQLRGPLPTVEEQHQIVAQVRRQTGRLRQLLDRMVEMTRILYRRRQALITAAVTGEIDV